VRLANYHAPFHFDNLTSSSGLVNPTSYASRAIYSDGPYFPPPFPPPLVFWMFPRRNIRFLSLPVSLLLLESAPDISLLIPFLCCLRPDHLSFRPCSPSTDPDCSVFVSSFPRNMVGHSSFSVLFIALLQDFFSSCRTCLLLFFTTPSLFP